MLIPRGTEDGMKFELFLVESTLLGQCCDTHNTCRTDMRGMPDSRLVLSLDYSFQALGLSS